MSDCDTQGTLVISDNFSPRSSINSGVAPWSRSSRSTRVSTEIQTTGNYLPFNPVSCYVVASSLATHMHTMTCACCPGFGTELCFHPYLHRNLWNLSCIVGNDSKCLSALREGCRNDYFLSLVILGYFRTICWPMMQSPVHRTFPRDLWGNEGKNPFVLSHGYTATSKVALRANANLSISV